MLSLEVIDKAAGSFNLNESVGHAGNDQPRDNILPTGWLTLNLTMKPHAIINKHLFSEFELFTQKSLLCCSTAIFKCIPQAQPVSAF